MNCWDQQHKSYVTAVKAVKWSLRTAQTFTLRGNAGDKELTMEVISHAMNKIQKPFHFPSLPSLGHYLPVLECIAVCYGFIRKIPGLDFPCETSPNSRMLHTFHYWWMSTPRAGNTVTERKTWSRIAEGTNKDTRILAGSRLIFEPLQSMLLGTVIRGKVKMRELLRKLSETRTHSCFRPSPTNYFFLWGRRGATACQNNSWGEHSRRVAGERWQWGCFFMVDTQLRSCLLLNHHVGASREMCSPDDSW